MNLEPEHIDALKEIINIGVGQAAGMLNEMLHARIHLQGPSVKMYSVGELEKQLAQLGQEPLAAVRLDFKGAFAGSTQLIFPEKSAANLVSILVQEKGAEATGPEAPDLDSVRIGTLTEVGNIVLNGVMGSIGNILGERLEYSVPTYMTGDVRHLLARRETDGELSMLLARTRFKIKELEVVGDIVLIFETRAFEALLGAVEAVIAESGELS